MPLTEQELLFDLGLVAGEAGVEIECQPNRVGCRIQQHITVFNRDALEPELRAVYCRALAGIAKTFRGRVEIQGDAIVVRHAIFEFLAQFPEVKIILMHRSSAGALGSQSDPLFEFHRSLWQNLWL